MTRTLTIAAACLWLATPARAQETDAAAPPRGHVPEIRMELEPARVATGDVVQLRIHAEVPAGDDVAVPEPAVAPFEILDRSRRREASGGRQTFTFEIDLLALRSGEHTLGPFTLRVVTADGDIGDVETPSRTVQVRSRLAGATNAKPRAPTQPVSAERVLQEDYILLWALLALLAAIAIAAAAVLLSRWWNRRQQAAQPPPPPRPPWELAMERLTTLQNERARILESEGVEVLVDRVSDVVRDYLGRVHGFEGLESTSNEVLEKLRTRSLSVALFRDIEDLLERSDLIKFARASAEAEESRLLIEKAMEIVRAGRPSPPGSDGAHAGEAHGPDHEGGRT